MFEALLAAWNPHKGLKAPPSEKIKLWGSGMCGVWIGDSWGPPIPYPAAGHLDGDKNHGYRRIKGNLAALDAIPEVDSWPELRLFLERINAVGCPIESVGCEKGFSPPDENVVGSTAMLGSYVEVMFTNALLNEQPENALLLASRLAPAVNNCEQWWGEVTFVLERFKYIAGVATPWGMMLHIKNHGRTEEEARKFWGESLKRLGEAASTLPAEFPAGD
jgi:hypothetical protein